MHELKFQKKAEIEAVKKEKREAVEAAEPVYIGLLPHGGEEAVDEDPPGGWEQEDHVD